MKKTITSALIAIIAIALAAVYFINKNDKTPSNLTTMSIVNNTEDTVVAYLTLGSLGDTSYVQNVAGIFGCEDTSFQGVFKLLPNDTLKYAPSKAFNGNICFGSEPLNCPDTNQWPTGLNLFEFNINNISLGGEETIDISGVAGFNSFIKVNMTEEWNDGINNLKSFYNKSVYENTGLSGVYPYGCDDCTDIKSPPVCPGGKKFAEPQTKAICNIQRGVTGGNVEVVFSGFIK